MLMKKMDKLTENVLRKASRKPRETINQAHTRLNTEVRRCDGNMATNGNSITQPPPQPYVIIRRFTVEGVREHSRRCSWSKKTVGISAVRNVNSNGPDAFESFDPREQRWTSDGVFSVCSQFPTATCRRLKIRFHVPWPIPVINGHRVVISVFPLFFEVIVLSSVPISGPSRVLPKYWQLRKTQSSTDASAHDFRLTSEIDLFPAWLWNLIPSFDWLIN